MGDVKKETVSTERLREMLAAIPRYANGNVRSAAWVGRVPAPTLEAILSELLALRQPDTRMEGGGEYVEVGTFIASSEHGVGVSWGDLGPLGTGDKLYARAAPSSPTVGEPVPAMPGEMDMLFAGLR